MGQPFWAYRAQAYVDGQGVPRVRAVAVVYDEAGAPELDAAELDPRLAPGDDPAAVLAGRLRAILADLGE